MDKISVSSTKPVIVFIFEKKMGGVAYMNIEIINNAAFREFFKVRVILVRQNDLDPREELYEKNIRADEICDFDFDPLSNRYYELKRLHSIIGQEEGVLVCNNFLELDCVSVFPMPKKVFQIVHDFYSIKLFIQSEPFIDAFLTHSKFWKEVLYSSGARNKSCKQLLHGITVMKHLEKKESGKSLKIAFTGRWVAAKGVMLLWEIDEELLKKNDVVEWVIIGNGILNAELKEQWRGKSNVKFVSPDNHQEVLDEMRACDIFVLPTEFEGYGIAIIEALSCGLVPVVSDIPGGTSEILADIGYKIGVRDVQGFASVISELNNNREKLKMLQASCRKIAEEKYDIRETANNYLNEFKQYEHIVKNKPKLLRTYGSFLDKPYFPVRFVKQTRKFMHKIRRRVKV